MIWLQWFAVQPSTCEQSIINHMLEFKSSVCTCILDAASIYHLYRYNRDHRGMPSITKLTECMSNPLINSFEIYWPVSYMVYDCLQCFTLLLHKSQERTQCELWKKRGSPIGASYVRSMMCVCGRKQAITTTNRYETLFYRWFLYQPTEIMMWQVKIWVIDQLIMIVRPGNCELW